MLHSPFKSKQNNFLFFSEALLRLPQICFYKHLQSRLSNCKTESFYKVVFLWPILHKFPWSSKYFICKIEQGLRSLLMFLKQWAKWKRRNICFSSQDQCSAMHHHTFWLEIKFSDTKYKTYFSEKVIKYPLILRREGIFKNKKAKGIVGLHLEAIRKAVECNGMWYWGYRTDMVHSDSWFPCNIKSIPSTMHVPFWTHWSQLP